MPRHDGTFLMLILIPMEAIYLIGSYRIGSDPYLELGDHIVARAGCRTVYLDFVHSKEAK